MSTRPNNPDSNDDNNNDEEFDMHISDLPKVDVQVADEASQLSTFVNSTLQGSLDGKWAVSVATYLEIPTHITTVDELKAHVKAELARGAEGSSLVFDAQAGTSLEYHEVVEEEARDHTESEEE